MSTLNELIEGGIDDLKDWINDNPQNTEPYDEIHEITDSITPIYSYDAIELVLNNSRLWNVESDIGAAYDGSITVVNVATALIYEAINQGLWEWWNPNHEEIHQLQRDLEDMGEDVAALLDDLSEYADVETKEDLKLEIQVLEEKISKLEDDLSYQLIG